MQYEIIPIQAKGSLSYARLHAYILDSSKEFQPDKIRPMIIICPGGGYEMTSDREAEPIAMRFLAMGYHVGVLRYSVAPARYPVALLELAEVMKLIHANKKEWHVDVEKLFIMGSSAGGHLAASFGVLWNQPFLCEQAGIESQLLKPCGLILNYPVIISEEPYAHEGSFRSLLGEKTEELRENLSLEKQVTKDTPSCFIWHTLTDKTVPVENSLLFASAAHKTGVSVELHIYPEGGHGLSLGDATSSREDGREICKSIQSWIDLLAIWLDEKVNK